MLPHLKVINIWQWTSCDMKYAVGSTFLRPSRIFKYNKLENGICCFCVLASLRFEVAVQFLIDPMDPLEPILGCSLRFSRIEITSNTHARSCILFNQHHNLLPILYKSTKMLQQCISQNSIDSVGILNINVRLARSLLRLPVYNCPFRSDHTNWLCWTLNLISKWCVERARLQHWPRLSVNVAAAE